MFRMISIIGFAVTSLGIGICCRVFPCCKKCQWAPPAVLKRIICVLTLLIPEWKSSRSSVVRKIAYILALFSFLGLVVTGFYPVLVLNEPIGGYWLILHVVFGPVFAASLACLAVMWAGNCSFDKNDRPRLQKMAQAMLSICFWLIVILAIPVILSIVLSMFSFFGTEGQELLLQLHRYGALLLALAVIVHTYLVIRTRMEK